MRKLGHFLPLRFALEEEVEGQLRMCDMGNAGSYLERLLRVVEPKKSFGTDRKRMPEVAPHAGLADVPANPKNGDLANDEVNWEINEEAGQSIE